MFLGRGRSLADATLLEPPYTFTAPSLPNSRAMPCRSSIVMQERVHPNRQSLERLRELIMEPLALPGYTLRWCPRRYTSEGLMDLALDECASLVGD